MFLPTHRYAEKACTTSDKKIGTLCELASGDCKKDRDCEAVATGFGKLSMKQIEFYASQYARKLVNEDFIDEETYENSKQFAIQLLLSAN